MVTDRGAKTRDRDETPDPDATTRVPGRARRGPRGRHGVEKKRMSALILDSLFTALTLTSISSFDKVMSFDAVLTDTVERAQGPLYLQVQAL